MSKKLVTIVTTMIVVLVVGFANTAFAMENNDNPIDKAFIKDQNEVTSTVEINYVVGKYVEAWKAEMNHAGIVIKEKYKFDEDKKRVDDYIEAYEKVAEAAMHVEWLNWSDTTQSPKGRTFGTGAISGSFAAKAIIYKQATFNLIAIYQGMEGNNPDNNLKYHYIYSGNGAELAKMKENMNKR